MKGWRALTGLVVEQRGSEEQTAASLYRALSLEATGLVHCLPHSRDSLAKMVSKFTWHAPALPKDSEVNPAAYAPPLLGSPSGCRNGRHPSQHLCKLSLSSLFNLLSFHPPVTHCHFK